MKTLRLLFIVLFIFIFTGCAERDPSTLSTKTSAGVVLHGNRYTSGSWIENTNDFTVNIKMVYLDFGFGEETKSIDDLEPKEKFMLPKPLSYTGFYVRVGISNREIGFISCR